MSARCRLTKVHIVISKLKDSFLLPKDWSRDNPEIAMGASSAPILKGHGCACLVGFETTLNSRNYKIGFSTDLKARMCTLSSTIKSQHKIRRSDLAWNHWVIKAPLDGEEIESCWLEYFDEKSNGNEHFDLDVEYVAFMKRTMKAFIN